MFYTAGAFYAAFLFLIVSRSWRHKFYGWTESTPPAGQSHLLALDGFRGLATAAVFFLHTWQWLKPYNDGIFQMFLAASPGLQQNPDAKMGNKPVAVFMILSGFLIYRTLRGRALSASDIRSYLIRRFFRIYPLYFACVVALATMGYLLPKPGFIQSFISEALMLRIFDRPIFGNPVAWSLYVEALVYLLMPLWVIATAKSPLKISLIGFILLCLTGSESFGHAGRELALIKYFVIGIVLCELYDRRYDQKIKPTVLVNWLLLGLGATLLLFDLMHLDIFARTIDFLLNLVSSVKIETRTTDLTFNLAIGSAIFLYATLNLPLVAKIFSWYPFRYLGLISYSFYMWHGFLITANTPVQFTGLGGITLDMNWPAQNGLGTLFFIYLPSAVFVSTVSFLLIENPFRKMHKRFT